MIQLTEFAAAMKTPLRYSFIIIMLGLFSSCAEQFREIRGSENRGNAFLGGGLTSSTATKRTDKAKSETVTPHQTVIHVKQAVTEPVAENTPNGSLNEPKIEKVANNPTSIIQGQKSSVISKTNGSSARTLEKKKPLKLGKILKKALSQRGNGKEVNGWLVALGIVGIIISILGLLTALLGAALGNGSLIMEFLGFYFDPIIIDIIVFLLGLISSIWLLTSPTLQDANAFKIAAIILAALPIFLILILFLGLILFEL